MLRCILLRMAIKLTGANQKTEWFDLSEAGESVCFNLTGDFSTAVGVHYSNLDSYSKETGYTVNGETWSAAIGPLEIPNGARTTKYVRFYSSGSWTSATTCTPSFAKYKNPDGKLVDVAPQSRTDQGTT